ncbi:hypothetical protein ACVDFE_00310 [Lentzea chajnantorensis]
MSLIGKLKHAKAQWDALNDFCAVCGVTGDCHCEFLEGWTDPEIIPAQTTQNGATTT